MKKLFILVVLLALISPQLMAQDGEIIHVVMNKKAKGALINFDQDSCYIDSMDWDPCSEDLHISHVYDWMYSGFEVTNWYYFGRSDWFFNLYKQVGDTISTGMNWSADYGNDFTEPDTLEFHAALRHVIVPEEGTSCYGWIHFKVTGDCNDYSKCWVYFYDYAYCTIPEYPLRVGQTDFTWDVEEVENQSDFTVSPNPSEGVFTVRGVGLASVEVYNTLGQHVLTMQANGSAATIDLANQPAGLYFINVTDDEGKRCVKKVVRQ